MSPGRRHAPLCFSGGGFGRGGRISQGCDKHRHFRQRQCIINRKNYLQKPKGNRHHLLGLMKQRSMSFEDKKQFNFFIAYFRWQPCHLLVQPELANCFTSNVQALSKNFPSSLVATPPSSFSIPQILILQVQETIRSAIYLISTLLSVLI